MTEVVETLLLEGIARTLHDAQPACLSRLAMASKQRHRGSGPTWIPRLAVCALVVTGDILHEVLESLLVASLLALAEGSGHIRGGCRKGTRGQLQCWQC